MAGRLRTASRPSKTVIEVESYAVLFFFVIVDVGVAKPISSLKLLLIKISTKFCSTLIVFERP